MNEWTMYTPWGPISKREEAYYRRLDREDKARKARREKTEQRLPYRIETLARVKAGEITLQQAQQIIKKHEKESDDESR
jgi:hypothetical protein